MMIFKENPAGCWPRLVITVAEQLRKFDDDVARLQRDSDVYRGKPSEFPVRYLKLRTSELA